MNNYLVESNIELAAIEWLQECDWRYIHGSEIHRPLKKVVLEPLLKDFLQKKYRHLPEKTINEALLTFLYNTGGDLDNRNRDFHLKLSKGIDICWKDNSGTEHFEHIYCVDYDNPLNNDFLAVNQFTVEGKNNRRPDLMLFVNGIPLVLFEFKNMFDTEATVENAYNQVQHYIEDIPQVFENNAITVISDGQTTLHGMYNSDIEWFGAWKSIDGLKIVEEDFALETLIKGLLTPERLLQYIRFYIFHGLDGGKLVKKGAKYHQFFGIQYALAQTRASIKPIGDGRIGVIWHTTRSGKSITMAIYSAILRQMPELKNPTIVVQVDRFDLDRQLFSDFVEAKDLVGDIKRADSADDLRELLSSDGGGVICEAVVDVFEMAGISKFDISIINDDFLVSAKEQKSGTEIKLELIRQIINNEIKVRQYKNLIKYKKLKEAVERIIKDYHEHFFDSLIALQKMREVARDMQEEDALRKTLGLNDEEEAFYEILAQHKKAIPDFKLIKEIVKDVTAVIKKNLQIDWFKKPDARAQIMLAVKKVLRNKVEGDELQIILTEIMEQADARYRELVA